VASIVNFRAQFPEFRTVGDSQVGAMLGAAALELDLTIWGAFGPDPLGNQTKSDQAQMYLAAHKLAVSPFGQAAKMVMDRRSGYARTTYGAEFLLIQLGKVVSAGVA
jgi:hypothetical protein